MGASFESVRCGLSGKGPLTKQINEAFDTCVSDALYDHGHDSYNGTISTVNGWKLKKECETRAEAEEIADEDTDTPQKWEYCCAVTYPNGDSKHVIFYGWWAT